MGFTSIGGITIPPRRKRKAYKTFTLRFALKGLVPSKKNNQVPLLIWKRADAYAAECFKKKGHLTFDDYKKIKGETQKEGLVKAFIRPNARHRDWHEKASAHIIAQRDAWLPHIASKGLIFPLSKVKLAMYIYKTDRIVRDFSNRLGSIEDLLTDCHVISDDNDRVVGNIELDGDDYIDEMRDTVTVIHLTALY